MEKLLGIADAFLASPITWGVLALVALAIALTGKLDVKGADHLLAAAWLLVVVGLFRAAPLLHRPLLPRVLLVMLFSSLIGLGLYWISGWMHTAQAAPHPQSATSNEPEPIPQAPPASPPPTHRKPASKRGQQPKSPIHVEQRSQGANSPNIATFGPNSPVTYSPVPLPGAPRNFSQEDYDKFVAALDNFGPSHAQLTIVGADVETSKFARQVEAGFLQANWKVSVNMIGQMNGAVLTDEGMIALTGEGLHCGAAKAEGPEVSAVMHAFESAGLKCEFNRSYYRGNSNRGDPPVAVVVGKAVR